MDVPPPAPQPEGGDWESTPTYPEGPDEVYPEEPYSDDPGAPIEAAPYDPAMPPTTEPAPLAPAPDIIERGDLDDSDAATAGLLDDAHGGLGMTMWAGSQRETIENMLQRLPTGTTSDAMNSLARRLLLTGAHPPTETMRAAGMPERSLTFLRIERLYGGGLTEDVVALIARLPEPDERATEIRVNALLLTGNDQEACGRVSAQRLESDEPFWLQMRAYCYAVEDNMPGASLAAELMRTRGDIDPNFDLLIGNIAESGTAKLESLADPAPLEIAMLRRAKMAVPADAARDAQPAVLRAIALSAETPIETRLPAGEAAAARGALGVSELRDLLAGITFKPRDFARVKEDPASIVGSNGAALLYQNVLKADGNSARAEALSVALRTAKSRGLYELYARVFAMELRELTPAVELAPQAQEFGEALLLAGKLDRVGDWYNVLQGAAAGADPVIRNYRLWMALAGPTAERIALAERALDDLADAASSLPPQHPAAQHAALVIGVFDALGYAVPPGARAYLRDSGIEARSPMPPDLQSGLMAASQGGRRGEVVLFALAAMGQSGPRQAHPAVVIAAVAALNAVDLSSDARALALEALLARPDDAGG